MNQAKTQDLKTALITGAGRRIGAAIAGQLHRAGYRVMLHCHHSFKEAQQLADDFNQKRADSAWVVRHDLCQPQAAYRIVTETLHRAGRLDVLVNNASVFIRNSMAVFEETLWDNLFTSNVKAPFLLSCAAQDALRQTQGVIINLTDIHAEKPLRDYSLYCQTKAALLMQTRSLAKEFAPEIRVNAVAPGAIDWPEQANSLTAEQQQKIIAKTPLKRQGCPQDIAKAVLALIENEFISGQVLNVDGGRSLG